MSALALRTGPEGQPSAVICVECGMQTSFWRLNDRYDDYALDVPGYAPAGQPPAPRHVCAYVCGGCGHWQMVSRGHRSFWAFHTEPEPQRGAEFQLWARTLLVTGQLHQLWT